MDNEAFVIKKKEIDNIYKKVCKESFKVGIKIASESLREFNEYSEKYQKQVEQIGIYITIWVGKLEGVILKALHYLMNDLGDGKEELLETCQLLMMSQREIDKALNIIDFRRDFPTAEDVLKKYSPPEHLIGSHREQSKMHWKKIAETHEDKKLTDDELDTYLDELDQKSLALVKDAEIWMRRKLSDLLDILEYGRCGSVFEFQSDRVPHQSQREYEISVRASGEKGFFGLPENLLEELRPIYTYISDDPNGMLMDDSGEDVENVSMADSFNIDSDFGPIAIHLKPVTKERAFKLLMDGRTVIDDKTINARPVPYNKADRNCFSISLDLEVDPLKFRTIQDIKPLAESLIFWALTVDDIDEIVFTNREEAPDAELANRLNQYAERYGFTWRVV